MLAASQTLATLDAAEIDPETVPEAALHHPVPTPVTVSKNGVPPTASS
jgi:hypothetical protein